MLKDANVAVLKDAKGYGITCGCLVLVRPEGRARWRGWVVAIDGPLLTLEDEQGRTRHARADAVRVAKPTAGARIRRSVVAASQAGARALAARRRLTTV